MKSRTVVIVSIISTTVFVAILSIGALLRCTGPVQLSAKLWVTSGYGYWLVYYAGDSMEQKAAPYFAGTIAIVDGDEIIVGNGVRTKCITDTRWHIWGDTGFLKERFVDTEGVTQLFTTDLRLPGIFYLHYQWIESRFLTFALRGWLLLGLPALFPGLWSILWIKGRLRTKKIRKDTEPAHTADVV